MAKEKEVAPKFNFEGTIAQSKYRVVGVPVHTSDKRAEKSLEEVLDDTNKAEVLNARKDLMVTQLKEKETAIRKQGDPNPKRYNVDPDTGVISVDEEGGEYTKQDALAVSSSIKVKGGHYDDAIALITAAKTLAGGDGQSKTVSEKPKVWSVDEDTGVVYRDEENGEYTLSEAKAVSKSLRDAILARGGGQKSFLEQLDAVTQGTLSKRLIDVVAGGGGGKNEPKDPADTVLQSLDQYEKLRKHFVPDGGGQGGVQTLLSAGGVSNLRTELVKLLLESENAQLKIKLDHEAQMERNKHLGVLAGTIKDNFEDIAGAARDMVKGHREQQPPKQEPHQDEGGYAVKCNLCGAISAFEEPPSGVFTCPKCQAQLKLSTAPTPDSKPSSSMDF